ncbi:aminoglycoside phosphotransferase family protein [Dongia sp. agr-C8]
MTSPLTCFDTYFARWNLIPDGAPIVTQTSRLLPVIRDGRRAMLKVATEDDERRGNAFMQWWNGDGAAAVIAAEGDALLMERLEDDAALATMARGGADDEASRIVCAVAAKLHAPRSAAPPPAMPLALWFAALHQAADREGGLFATAHAVARDLLADLRDVTVLHGDIHHFNILRSPAGGWRAIDPKGVIGERAYDFANILCNPDPATAEAPGRLSQQLSVIAAAAGLDRHRLLQWVLAHAGLSAAWSIEDGASAEPRLAVAKIALAELAKA